LGGFVLRTIGVSDVPIGQQPTCPARTTELVSVDDCVDVKLLVGDTLLLAVAVSLEVCRGERCRDGE
jgi:hypothetical protein